MAEGLRVVLRGPDGEWVGSVRLPGFWQEPPLVVIVANRVFLKDETLWASYIVRGNAYREVSCARVDVSEVRQEEPC